MATRRHDEAVGAEKLAQATGRPREEWHELLDAAGATGWKHKQMAEWLVTEHAVDGWWAQGITVGYEQARGMRQPGQRPDGTFAANVTKTIGRSASAVFSQLVDDTLRARWLGGNWRVAGSSAPKRARFTDDEGARVLIEVDAVSPEKVRVSVQHAKLPDPDAVAEKKSYWKEALGRLAAELA